MKRERNVCARPRGRAHAAKISGTARHKFANGTGRRAYALPPELLGGMAGHHLKNPSSNGVARTVPESLLADHEAPPEALPTSAATRTAFLTPGAGTCAQPHGVKARQRARSVRWRSASEAP